MLTNKEINEIKEHLEKAQNPIFFFDNDADGLCSFLLLSRFIGRGKGVAIKSFPDLQESYARKLHELNPDYIFILDKPIVSEGFIEEARKLSLPVVWIDHHNVDAKIFEDVFYYNSARKQASSNEPVTYIAWKITEKKQDQWLALSGCISDNYLPDFNKEFSKDNPDLLDKDVKSAFQALYDSEIGKITRIMSFGLKDSVSNVVSMIKFLQKIQAPNELLLEDSKNHILSRFEQIDKKYQKLIEKAQEHIKEKLIYFSYGGDLSLSADIANELYYRNPHKLVVVVFISGAKANISIRGKRAKEISMKAIEGLIATGGGHDEAVGCKVNVEDLPIFKERIENLVQ